MLLDGPSDRHAESVVSAAMAASAALRVTNLAVGGKTRESRMWAASLGDGPGTVKRESPGSLVPASRAQAPETMAALGLEMRQNGAPYAALRLPSSLRYLRAGAER